MRIKRKQGMKFRIPSLYKYSDYCTDIYCNKLMRRLYRSYKSILDVDNACYGNLSLTNYYDITIKGSNSQFMHGNIGDCYKKETCRFTDLKKVTISSRADKYTDRVKDIFNNRY